MGILHYPWTDVNGWRRLDRVAQVAVQIPVRTRGCSSPVAPPLDPGRAESLADVYKALADPTRVQMVHMLKAAAEPVCVCDFTAAFELSQPTVSHHLSKLRRAGLISSIRQGIWTFHSLADPLPEPARGAIELIP